MAIALRNDFKYPHANVVDKSTLIILQRQQECCVSLLYQTRNVILQTLYRMLDAEMDSLKPASSHDVRFPGLSSPFISSCRVSAVPIHLVARNGTGVGQIADLNGRDFGQLFAVRTVQYRGVLD